MLVIAIGALLGSAASAFLVGTAVIAPRESFLRTKLGVWLLIMLGVSLVTLPPQLPWLADQLGSQASVLPGLEWPDSLGVSAYLGAWALTSLAALLIGMRIWRAGDPSWREGRAASDASPASRVAGMLAFAETLPAVIDLLARSGLRDGDVPRVAEDLRIAGLRLSSTLPQSDGALYGMVAAKLPTSTASAVTGYLLEGAGRRSTTR